MTTSQPNLVLCEFPESQNIALESYSPFCMKVHRALRVAGLKYERRFGRPSDFKHYNPAVQLPVLLVDGEPLADTTRILRWIVTIRPQAFPQADARTEAEAWLWEDFSDTALNGFLVASRWGDNRNWQLVKSAYFGAAPWPVRSFVAPMIRKKVIKTLISRDFLRSGESACWDRFERSLDQLEVRTPVVGYWVDSRLSVADIGIFSQLSSLCTVLTPWQSEQVAARPKLSAYLARVDEATCGSSSAKLASLRAA